MKKYLFLSVVVLAALFSSCKKDFSIKPDEPQKVVSSDCITASVPDTVFSFPAGGQMSAWQIDNKSFIYTSTAAGSSTVFNYTGEAAVPTRIAYALYPAVKVDSLYKGRFYLNLKSEQTAVEGGVDPEAPLFTGHVSDKAVNMVPAYGVFKFTINQADIASCEISTSSGKVFCGPIKIQMDTVPAPYKVENSLTKVILKGGLKKGSAYGIVAMVNNYGAVDVTLRNAYDVVVWNKTIDAENNLTPGKTIDLGNLGNPNVSSLTIKSVSTEYVGYKVKSIVGYSAATQTRIFGGDVNQEFKSGETLTARFFGLEPTDYSGTEIWYLYTMEKDGKGICLPIKGQGFNVPASSEVTQDLGTISESRNAAPWYCPVEDTRLKCGDGYAFGEANTYLIQYKGSTYSGTVDPDPNIPDEVVIDYRLRGELFGGAPKPEGVTFEWVQGYNNSGTWGVYTGDRGKITNGTNFTFEVDADNYKVKVKNTGAHAQSPVLVMKKGDDIIWAWTFWNIAADGTRFTPVNFGNIQVAPLDLGQCSTQITKIVAKLTEIRRTTWYYQWGRPIPTFSQYAWGLSFGQNDPRNHASTPRIPVVDCGPTDVATSIKNPTRIIIDKVASPGTASATMNSWIAGNNENFKDLWGSTGKDKEGIKSIYDPCPKGYRVIDAKAVANKFPSMVTASAYTVQAYPQIETAGYHGVYLDTDALFVCSGLLTASASTGRSINTGGCAYGTGNTAKANTRSWTNTYSSGTSAYSFRYDYYWEKYDRATVYSDRKIGLEAFALSKCMAVRCMVDKDNR